MFFLIIFRLPLEDRTGLRGGWVIGPFSKLSNCTAYPLVGDCPSDRLSLPSKTFSTIGSFLLSLVGVVSLVSLAV